MNKLRTILFSGAILLVISFSGCEKEKNEYLVTLHPSNDGTTEGEGMFAAGSSVTVVATANEDFEFSNWREYFSGEVVSSDANYTFTISENVELTAYFADAAEKIMMIRESENVDMPIIANYTTPVPLDKLKLMTRYIGDLFLTEGISKEKSGVTNQNGKTQMVINTQDLEDRGLYSAIQGGGPHIWIAKQPSPDSIFYPWAEPTNELVFQMNASVPFVELRDEDGNTASSGFTAGQAPVTQLSFGFYLFDESSNSTFAYIAAVYESRGTYQESANNSDTYVSFVSSPLEESSLYITKAPESASLQEVPFSGEKFFKMQIKPENLLKAIRDTNMGLSEDLSNYRLTFAGVLFELPNYVEDGHNTSMVNVSDFSVYVK